MRGITFLPQIVARAGDSVFGAKIPLPAFFMANALLLPAAAAALLLRPPFTYPLKESPSSPPSNSPRVVALQSQFKN